MSPCVPPLSLYMSSTCTNPPGHIKGFRPPLHSFSNWQVARARPVPAHSSPCVGSRARVGRRASGKAGLLYCEPFSFFSERAGFMLTLKTSLAASAESENAHAMSPRMSLLGGTFPHVCKETCIKTLFKAALLCW